VVIILPYTVPHPGAMVVHHKNAPVAYGTVMGSLRLGLLALPAPSVALHVLILGGVALTKQKHHHTLGLVFAQGGTARWSKHAQEIVGEASVTKEEA